MAQSLPTADALKELDVRKVARAPGSAFVRNQVLERDDRDGDVLERERFGSRNPNLTPERTNSASRSLKSGCRSTMTLQGERVLYDRPHRAHAVGRRDGQPEA
jgi:hypothetical protein